MRILLTGYKGFIGSNMLKALEHEHEVDTFEWGEIYPDVRPYDWVIHMGAISSTNEKNVEKVMLQNYEFSVDLYEDCSFYGVNFQFSSSASVYGLGTSFKESSPVDPRSPYAWSKYLFERYVEKNPPERSLVQIFRYFNVYGPGEGHKDQPSPFHAFKVQAEKYGKIKVFENSQNYRRDFIHVDRVIDYHKRFFDIDESGLWNIGTGTTKSFLDVASSFGVDLEVIPMPTDLVNSYQQYTCADLTKLKNTLMSRGH